MRRTFIIMAVFLGCLLWTTPTIWGQSGSLQDSIYDPGTLKPRDSTLKVRAGDKAPDFSLPALSGKRITLSQFEARKMW
jgi:peroxiredoxin (alkyl hydroperoxide reductase subunit C)